MEAHCTKEGPAIGGRNIETWKIYHSSGSACHGLTATVTPKVQEDILKIDMTDATNFVYT
jgi:hypothetical protein